NNLPNLAKRLSSSLGSMKHELLFIDDRSTDGSVEVLETIRDGRPQDHIRIIEKRGKQGKATSLLEGIIESQGDVIAMIDADLQYPPEAIPDMVKKLSVYDIVVGNRKRQAGYFRKIMSVIYNFAFGRVLLGLPYDVQSGLKVFRKQTLHNLNLSPTPWGFDYDFLFKARRLGWRIGQIDIPFSERAWGQSHINVITAGWELAAGGLKLRLRYLIRSIFKFLDWPHKSERFGYNWKNTQDFLYVPEIMSAKKHIYSETVTFAAVCAFVAVSLIYGFHAITGISVVVTISGIMAAFYLALLVFKLWVVYSSLKRPFLNFSQEEIDNINPYDLPTYTILIPLYKEAEVIRQIIKAMSAIDYPAEKLDIIITLEEYDHETIQAIENANPPSHFKTLILPDVQPKTKPKALNVAFPHAKGEFLVIYDAEIVPDPDQLKKAYLAFQKHPEVDVLQTRLDHYNPDQSFITKLFNAEFSFHFDLFLPGLQKLGFPIPLSGHSTHFRRSALEEIGAWDPYNVTEDCDNGIRLARLGKKVDILDSVSKEEATTSFQPWVNQRSRWIKGFIQTAIVHMRYPLRFKDEIGGWGKLSAFLITVPGSVVINIANLFYWALLIGWYTTHSKLIQSFFPGPIFYVSLFSFIVGNLIFIYFNLIGSYMRGRFDIVKYSLLSPVYWLMLAYASVKAAVELMVKPHHWSKTTHGKHLDVPEKERIGSYVIKSPQIEI
ncbi:MAG: glycosyltransferase, partial [Candidatus Doudnabacteria bacterium]|nr:glycosyltransferase [Candidatus Doudnabacteria bacterium]